MSNEKFKVKYGLTVGDNSTVIDTSGNILTTGNITAPALKSASGTTAVTLSGADATVAGALTVQGDLTVNGTTTTIDTTNLVIEDNTILLNKNETGSGITAGLAGIEIERGTAPNVSWEFNETYDWWTAGGPAGTNNIFAGGSIIAGETLATNGNNLYFNNDDGSPDADVNIVAKRSSGADSALRWNETTDKWEQDRAGTTTVIATNTDELNEGTSNLYYTSARANADFDTRLATKTTDNLNEGTTNQYFTNTRARQAISVTDTGGDGSLSYDNSTGVITYTGPSAAEVRAKFSGGTGVTYNSTTGEIAIGQAVATTSDVTFNTAKTALSMATGGASLTSGAVNTFATLSATGTTSGSISLLGVRAENVTTGYGASSLIIDHGQNRPSGTSTTSGSPVFGLESTRGTSSTPTASGANDTLGVLQFAGHDGVRGLGSQINGSSVQIIGTAASAYTNDGTYTTNAGANLLVRTQPTNMRLTSASRQALFFQNYTTVAGAPPTQNILWNSSSMATQYDNTGTTYNGNGKQAHTFYHPTFSIYGVPSQSTANVDNNSLLGTNTLAFYSSRQSGWSGRRDAVQSGDTLAQINVFGQTGTDSTGNGSQTGTLQWTAAENFGASNRGSTFTLQTGVIGGNTLTNRLSLDSNQNTLTSDKFQLQNNAGNAYLYADSGLTNLMSPTGHLNISGEFTHINTISTNSRGIVLQPSPDIPATGKYTEATFATNRNPGTAGPNDYSAINFTTYNTTDGVNYTPTQSGEYIGQFKFNGNANTSTSPGVPGGPAATIQVQATENWSGSGTGAKIKFSVAGNGDTNGTDVITASPDGTTFQADTITLNSSTGSPLTGNKINYTRTYGEFAYTNASGFAIPAQNTIYTMPLDTTNFGSGISISGTGSININVAGTYKLIISLQATMLTNSVGQFDFWLRKNGVDVANSKTQVDLLKDQKSVVAMDWMVQSNGTDYFEIVYASASANYANISFPTIAATTTPFVSPLAPALILNVIPVGA